MEEGVSRRQSGTEAVGKENPPSIPHENLKDLQDSWGHLARVYAPARPDDHFPGAIWT